MWVQLLAGRRAGEVVTMAPFEAAPLLADGRAVRVAGVPLPGLQPDPLHRIHLRSADTLKGGADVATAAAPSSVAADAADVGGAIIPALDKFTPTPAPSAKAARRTTRRRKGN